MRRALPDSSCLISLRNAELLYLLKDLFDEIIIPLAVQREIGFQLDWISAGPITPQPYSPSLQKLGEGEREAIALALQIEGVVLILDDREARKIAENLNLPHTGTLGLLVQAKRQGIITSVKPCMDALEKVGFRYSRTLYQKILKMVDEDQ